MSKQLKKYLAKQLKAIKPFFSETTQSLSDRDIHVLRLSIKKIKALFGLVNSVQPSFDREEAIKPFDDLFDQAGKIREAQIKDQMIASYSPAPLIARFRKRLAVVEKTSRHKLIDMLDDGLWKELRKKSKKVAKVIDHIGHKSITRFMSKNKKHVYSEFTDSVLSPETMHEMRKEIKAMKYVQDMVHKKSTTIFTDAFQELIGRWHDGMMLLQGFHQYAQHAHLVPADKSAAVALELRIRRRTNSDFARIMQRRNKIINRI